jgi:excisionase family DNA binding protein
MIAGDANGQTELRAAGKRVQAMIDEYVSIQEAADRLSVAYNTVRNAILAGKLTAYKILGTYRIRVEDLEAFIEAGRVEKGGREAKPPALRASALKHLDGARLRAAWTAQGVRPPRQGGRSAASSEPNGAPSAGTSS